MNQLPIFADYLVVWFMVVEDYMIYPEDFSSIGGNDKQKVRKVHVDNAEGQYESVKGRNTRLQQGGKGVGKTFIPQVEVLESVKSMVTQLESVVNAPRKEMHWSVKGRVIQCEVVVNISREGTQRSAKSVISELIQRITKDKARKSVDGSVKSKVNQFEQVLKKYRREVVLKRIGGSKSCGAQPEQIVGVALNRTHGSVKSRVTQFEQKGKVFSIRRSKVYGIHAEKLRNASSKSKNQHPSRISQ